MSNLPARAETAGIDWGVWYDFKIVIPLGSDLQINSNFTTPPQRFKRLMQAFCRSNLIILQNEIRDYRA